jgi:hypothetical protein
MTSKDQRNCDQCGQEAVLENAGPQEFEGQRTKCCDAWLCSDCVCWIASDDAGFVCKDCCECPSTKNMD